MFRRFAALVVLGMFLALSAMAETEIRGWNKQDKWQYLQLGQYMYEKDGTMAPVLWRILYVENDTALMITENILDLVQPVYVDNEKEYKAKKGIKPASMAETDIPEWFDTVMWPVLIGDDPMGKAFMDLGEGKLFCMPKEEWTKTEYGFTKNVKPSSTRIAYPTPYCQYKKMYDWSSTIPTWENGIKGSPYWVSTFRTGMGFLQIVGVNGHLSWAGAGRPNVGIRPAAQLDLTLCRVKSGEGTVTAPWILEYAGE